MHDNPIFTALTGVDAPEGAARIEIKLPLPETGTWIKLDGAPQRHGYWEGYYRVRGPGQSNPCISMKAKKGAPREHVLAVFVAMVTNNRPDKLAKDWAERVQVKVFDKNGDAIYERVFA